MDYACSRKGIPNPSASKINLRKSLHHNDRYYIETSITIKDLNILSIYFEIIIFLTHSFYSGGFLDL